MWRKANNILMNKGVESNVMFIFLGRQLVNRIRPNPAYPLAQNTTLQAGSIIKYYLTTVVLRTLTFSNGSQSYIDNAVLGPVSNGSLFTMIKIKDFLGCG